MAASSPDIEALESKMELPSDEVAAKNIRNPNRLAPGRYNDIDYSITLPFLKRPTGLDGSHAGDFGFGESVEVWLACVEVEVEALWWRWSHCGGGGAIVVEVEALWWKLRRAGGG